MQCFRILDALLPTAGRCLVYGIKLETVLDKVLNLLPLLFVLGRWRRELTTEHGHRLTARRAPSWGKRNGLLERLPTVEANERETECLNLFGLGKI